ncbi:MAG: hypothetical protein ABJJ53_10435 [Sulfitobacter sp.]
MTAGIETFDRIATRGRENAGLPLVECSHSHIFRSTQMETHNGTA